MQQSHVYYLIRSVIIVVFAVLFTTTTVDAQTNGIWTAKIISVQGKVESILNNETQRSAVLIDEEYHVGDRIIVGEDSRATIMLTDDTTIRLDQKTSILFKATEKKHWLSISKGVTHFISRIIKKLNIEAPIVNGSIEGTEFMVSVAGDHTAFTVIEGFVDMKLKGAALGTDPTRVYSGEYGEAVKTSTIISKYTILPVQINEAVQWTLHYPPVIYYSDKDFTGINIKNSINFYWKGKLSDAFKEIIKVTVSNDPNFYLYRAGLYLTVGRVDKAVQDINMAETLLPGTSDTLALLSIIELSKGNKTNAHSYAENAIGLNDQSASALIALSYVQQADFNLDGALESIRKAVKYLQASNSTNPLLMARYAELLLSVGELEKAVNIAEEAVDMKPGIAKAHTVLGFAYLTQTKIQKAKDEFEEAIKLDDNDPDPKLGLGLAMIREGGIKDGLSKILRGNLKEGVKKIRKGGLDDGIEEIKQACTADPNNSLIRSYLGKAYFDNNDNKKAAREFKMAKKLDPKDPTPLFYDAIRKQTLNMPVEALHDMQKSIDLNDNRAIYRSKFLLDSDLAARSASIARIYRDLDFQKRALFEGWKSVDTEPGNYSAHRFLADSYSSLPRHDIARVSELLQSQLLQPINISPIQPLLAESNLNILEGSGPSDAAYNEYNSLFNRNRLALQMNGLFGDKSTLGDNFVQSGVIGRASYSIGHFHYQSEGFQKNNQQTRDVYNGFFQFSLSHKTSVQVEYRRSDAKFGDLPIKFYPEDFDYPFKQEEQSDSVRLGFRHSFTPKSKLIGSFIYKNTDDMVKSFGSGSTASLHLNKHLDEDGWMGELRYLHRFNKRYYITGGLGRFSSERKDSDSTVIDPFPLTVPPFSDIPPIFGRTFDDKDIRHSNFYLYSKITLPKEILGKFGDMTWTIGGSIDIMRDRVVHNHSQFNPKLGLTWNLRPETTLRAALFKTMKRQLLSNQTIEPTQVAGFNQFFDDINATETWRYGVAMDHKFHKTLYGGAEVSWRELEVPSTLTSGGTTSFLRTERKEDLIRTYLYWTPELYGKSWFSMSAEYQLEWLERDPDSVGDEAFTKLKTHRLPLGIKFFHPSGISVGLKGTYVDQEGKFGDPIDSLNPLVSGDDQFVVYDSSISYRMPNRGGIFSLGVKNMFDRQIKFQDTDPANPEIYPGRFVFARFTLSF